MESNSREPVILTTAEVANLYDQLSTLPEELAVKSKEAISEILRCFVGFTKTATDGEKGGAK